jgi:hypothetical protein
MKKYSYILSCLLSLVAVLAVGATSASAEITCGSCKPWWHIESGSLPANIPPGGTGNITVTVADLGDADANGDSSFEDPAGSGVFGTPIKITDTLPP